MRAPPPMLVDGMRSVELLFVVTLNFAFASGHQATPASEKKNSSVGRNPVARPNSLVPKSGTRTSAFATAILEPIRRSYTGQAFGFDAAATHSLGLIEPMS